MGDDQYRARLIRLLSAVDFEVIPLRAALENASVLPVGSTVTVTASPSRGMQATVDLTAALQQSGYRAVPHLAARMIGDRSQLVGMLDTLQRNGVTGVFVIGGDPAPMGAYHDAGSLLREMADLGHPFTDVGIAGYPGGHPEIDTTRLTQALHDKAAMATHVVTQMNFEPGAIIQWVRDLRADGVELPVRIGVPGVVDTSRLLAVAARIGVGDSLRVLAKSRGLLRVLRPGRYQPDRLIEGVADNDEDLGVEGIHLFTFNQVQSSAAWRDDWLASLGDGSG